MLEPVLNCTLTGRITDLQGAPLQGLIVRAFGQYPNLPISQIGKGSVTDAKGRYQITYVMKSPAPREGTRGLVVSIKVFKGDVLLGESPAVDWSKLLRTIDLQVAYSSVPPVEERRIEGRILLEDGAPAEGLKLRLYRRDFGGKSHKVSETTTLEEGIYTLPFDSGERRASFELRLVKDDLTEIPLSKPLNDLDSENLTAVNLVAPGIQKPQEAEYRRLTANLAPQVGEMAKLVEADENDDRQDLGDLYRLTGEDPRLIGLAATVEALCAESGVELSHEAVYGLLRAGLPSDKLMLALMNPEVIEKALIKVRDAGVIDLTDEEIERFKEQFTAFSDKERLKAPLPGSRSTVGDLLGDSELDKDPEINEDLHSKFASVLFKHQDNPTELWVKAGEAGLDERHIAKLKLQGKMAFLTGNSRGMTNRLMRKQIDDPVKLVEQGFHSTEAWQNELLGAAAETPLDELLPPGYTGEKIENRLRAYSEDLARKVRLSYPTQVMQRLCSVDEKFKPFVDTDACDLLKRAAETDFRIGETPITAYLKANDKLTEGMTEPQIETARRQLVNLHRVYQITPCNEAMPVMMSLGLTSAHDVMEYSEAEFVKLFNARYQTIHHQPPRPDVAVLVYFKAKQVSAVTYNLFTIASQVNNAPAIAGVSAPLDVQDNSHDDFIKSYPTMESLFGSLDYCECEHCRSVLSPAAYLVDLLQFLDYDSIAWTRFQELWSESHNGQGYPHKDDNGNVLKPYDVLTKRRPDLPNIELTCENTTVPKIIPAMTIG